MVPDGISLPTLISPSLKTIGLMLDTLTHYSPFQEYIESQVCLKHHPPSSKTLSTDFIYRFLLHNRFQIQGTKVTKTKGKKVFSAKKAVIEYISHHCKCSFSNMGGFM
eukprot:jgi/Psemu1/36566/gm1.36566_g